MEKEPSALVQEITQTLFDKKGFNILALDVQDLSTMTDYLVLAEGNVDRHVIALAQAVKTSMNESAELMPLRMEGRETGEWMVMDYGEIMVHLFTPGLREKYGLEEVWREAKVMDTEIKVPEMR